MPENPIPFNELAWTEPHKGVREKSYSSKGQKIRLVEFHDDFIEEDWCIKNHIGYVLSGTMKIDFKDSELISYSKGDGLIIDDHTPHKVIIAEEEQVSLILVEQDH